MSLLFNSAGHLIVVTPPAGLNYEPAALSIPTIGTDCPANSVFVLRSKYRADVIYTIEKTLSNKAYFYSAGTEFKPMVIQGLAFNPDSQCAGSESENGLNLIRSWFAARQAYVSAYSMRTIEITIGNETMVAFLVGLQVEQPFAHIPLFRFTITVEPLSVT